MHTHTHTQKRLVNSLWYHPYTPPLSHALIHSLTHLLDCQYEGNIQYGVTDQCAECDLDPDNVADVDAEEVTLADPGIENGAGSEGLLSIHP